MADIPKLISGSFTAEEACRQSEVQWLAKTCCMRHCSVHQKTNSMEWEKKAATGGSRSYVCVLLTMNAVTYRLSTRTTELHPVPSVARWQWLWWTSNESQFGALCALLTVAKWLRFWWTSIEAQCRTLVPVLSVLWCHYVFRPTMVDMQHDTIWYNACWASTSIAHRTHSKN